MKLFGDGSKALIQIGPRQCFWFTYNVVGREGERRFFFTLRLPARMVYLQVEGLGAGLLDDRHVVACPLVGPRQCVGPPVRPVDTAPEQGHGKRVRQVLVAPQDLNDPCAVVQRRVDGIGAAGKTEVREREGEGEREKERERKVIRVKSEKER